MNNQPSFSTDCAWEPHTQEPNPLKFIFNIYQVLYRGYASRERSAAKAQERDVRIEIAFSMPNRFSLLQSKKAEGMLEDSSSSCDPELIPEMGIPQHWTIDFLREYDVRCFSVTLDWSLCHARVTRLQLSWFDRCWIHRHIRTSWSVGEGLRQFPRFPETNLGLCCPSTCRSKASYTLLDEATLDCPPHTKMLQSATLSPHSFVDVLI